MALPHEVSLRCFEHGCPEHTLVGGMRLSCVSKQCGGAYSERCKYCKHFFLRCKCGIINILCVCGEEEEEDDEDEYDYEQKLKDV